MKGVLSCRVAALALALTGGFAAWPQAQAPADQPIFRAGVDLIAVDVVVLDADGQQVSSLTAEDFAVQVDGRPRAVVSSEYATSGDPVVPGGATRQTPPSGQLPPATDPAGNLIVFAVDVGATSPESRNLVIDAATAVLDRLPPTDRVATVALPLRVDALAFTANRPATREALQRIGGWSPRLGRQLPFGVVEAMGAAGLESEPEWERAVARICATGDEFTRSGCRSVLESDARALVQEAVARTATSTSGLEVLLRVLQRVEGPKTILYFSEELATDGARVELDRLARAAAAARARVHALHAQPPTPDASFTSIRFEPIKERRRQVEGLELVSDWTGGDFFTLGPSQELAGRLIAELSGRYQLMVETAPGDRDGRPHRIQVQVPGRTLTVRARREFVADNLRTTLTPPPGADLPGVAVAEVSAQAVRPARSTSFVVTVDLLHPNRGAPETLRVQRALALAMASRGFRAAEDARTADVRLELAGQRLLRGPGRMPVVFLTRVTVSAAGRIAEIRGRNQNDRDLIGSSVEETAHLVDEWLGPSFDADRPPVPDSPSLAVGPAPGTAATLLPRMRAYVAAYETALAGIVAEEAYEQVYSERVMPFPAPPRLVRRALRSEMGYAWFPSPGTWFGFRDVFEADGRPVADRQQRLERLFLEREFPSDEQLARVADSSARFNLGPARRNFNVPTMALLVASPANQGRFTFDLLGYDHVDAVPVAVISFRETGSPTIITREGRDWPSQGLLWVEPDSGRVRRTDLQLRDRDIETRHTTWFTLDKRLDLLVPARMREVYDYVGRADEYVEATADYSNVRRFRVVTSGVPR